MITKCKTSVVWYSQRDSNPRSLEWESNILGRLDDESIIAPAWTRTMNLQLRRLLLYPLSYWSVCFRWQKSCPTRSISFRTQQIGKRICNDRLKESLSSTMWRTICFRTVTYSLHIFMYWVHTTCTNVSKYRNPQSEIKRKFEGLLSRLTDTTEENSPPTTRSPIISCFIKTPTKKWLQSHLNLLWLNNKIKCTWVKKLYFEMILGHLEMPWISEWKNISPAMVLPKLEIGVYTSKPRHCSQALHLCT